MAKELEENSVSSLKEGQRPDPALINHNGFTHAPPFTQVMPPILILVSLVASLIQLPVLWPSGVGVVVLAVWQVAVFVAVGVLWVVATRIVPTDSTQLKHLAAIERGESFDVGGPKFFCQMCKTYTNKNVFHCKKCCRCVQYFDHHCKWLNNCIGAKNYFEFYALIISCFLLLTTTTAVSCYTISRIASDDVDSDLGLGTAVVGLVVSIVPVCWLIYLIGLHTYLICAKRTTIELILESRRKNRIHPTPHSTSLKNTSIPNNKELSLPSNTPGQPSEQLSSDTNKGLMPQSKLQSSMQSMKGGLKKLPPVKSKMRTLAEHLDVRVVNVKGGGRNKRVARD